mmetsp:Transcript_20520/g.56643  ORF Transcript_20520/g.56643 Transcript_20520/m.56643 type:complete len:257 (-) Transcript_20520:32-802(-)
MFFKSQRDNGRAHHNRKKRGRVESSPSRSKKLSSKSMISFKPRQTIGRIHQVFKDKDIPWAVDMDGTLISEDVTIRAIVKSVSIPFLWPFFLSSLVVLSFGGPKRFLRFLEHLIPLAGKDVTYNSQLQKLIESHHARGGTAVLATASHFSTGETIVHDGGLDELFDEVWGSCMKKRGPVNVLDMKAEEKANVLAGHLPTGRNKKKGFVYAGNSKDDLKIWNHPSCKGMILVNCDDEVLQEAIKIPKPRLIIPRQRA